MTQESLDLPTSLALNDFDFTVPEHLVAQCPAKERDQARLIVLPYQGAIKHRYFRDITSEIPENSLIILNDSKVLPGRLFGTLETGARIEIFLMEETETAWICLARPLKKLHEGSLIDFGKGLVGRAHRRMPVGGGLDGISVQFSLSGDALGQWLAEHGYIPLPPYIERKQPKPASMSEDSQRYQTVYANDVGSVAAPTAGLHFTEEILSALKDRGTAIARICLHVGGGTFLPVKSENPDDHVMHTERYFVPRQTFAAIEEAKAEGRPIFAVGTTSFRAVESLYKDLRDVGSTYEEKWRTTNLFVRPKTRVDRYKSKIFSGMITNFHQPKSTLFMLIAALIGLERAKSLYQTAVAENYRFYSYGDSNLLFFEGNEGS